ncbi:MAG: hypothetical protein OHK0052_23220 [Anaerolineales bacterium]
MTALDDLLHQLVNGSESQADSAARAIAALEHEAITPLAGLLRDPNPETRWWAVRSLAEIPLPEAAAHLLTALQDPDENVQHCALLGLRQHPAPENVAVLCDMLRSPNPMTTHLAADALIAIGAPAVAPLLEILKTETAAIRIQAARALAKIGDTRSIAGLFDLYQDDSALLEYWAEQGLEKMGVGMQFFTPD